MNWPWTKRPAPISLGVIEELVRREVERLLAAELSHEVIGLPPHARKTRVFELMQRLVKNNLHDWLRACAMCSQPFLVPRETPGMADLYAPQPSPTRYCAACRPKDTEMALHGYVAWPGEQSARVEPKPKTPRAAKKRKR